MENGRLAKTLLFKSTMGFVCVKCSAKTENNKQQTPFECGLFASCSWQFDILYIPLVGVTKYLSE
jgi:DNA-directed RNA polymerase subunit RPC12/RpoP